MRHPQPDLIRLRTRFLDYIAHQGAHHYPNEIYPHISIALVNLTPIIASLS